ncbi:MAG: hypothetical protein JXA57_15915 [Armatimonadetes bacterium]|nr:hypothetical protein [Armatimonadota bacterium]
MHQLSGIRLPRPPYGESEDVQAPEFPEALFARVMEFAEHGLSDDVAMLAVSLGEPAQSGGATQFSTLKPG